MFIDDYRPEDYTKGNYFDVEDGIHDMKVMGAIIKTSKNGKQMIEITYQVRDCPAIPYVENIVEGEYFNRNMTRFFDAFGIPQGTFNFQNWIYKYGKGCFEHRQETFTGNDGLQKTINKCRLAYLVTPERTEPQKPQNAQPQQFSF